MEYKENGDKARERLKAFWSYSCIDRCALSVQARRTGADMPPQPEVDLLTQWTDTDYILDSAEARFRETYYAAEAIPCYHPFIGSGSIAAFMGSPLNFAKDTVWFSQVIDDWSGFTLQFDENNQWWKKVIELTRVALERGKDKYFVGLTDFHGAGDSLLLLRGSQNLCMDFILNPDDVKNAIRYLTDVIIQCFNVLSEMILNRQDGITTWMGLWAEYRHDVLSEDVAALISPDMFREFFREELEQYSGQLDKSIFHLDGPDALRHLDFLLEIPQINAIQWVPGDGKPEAVGWIPVLKKIQDKGKGLFVYSSASNVEKLLSELKPEGLFIHVYDIFDNQDDADSFIRKVEKWCCSR